VLEGVIYRYEFLTGWCAMVILPRINFIYIRNTWVLNKRVLAWIQFSTEFALYNSRYVILLLALTPSDQNSITVK
jgi:hypothetical protein